jgi:hypothetical protein
MLPLFLAMRRIGDAPLLWVNETEEADQVGRVETILPGLFGGYIDRFAPPAQFEKASLLAWLDICANAYILARQT